MSFSLTLGEIAERLGGKLVGGQPKQKINSLATLESASSEDLSFFAHKNYKKKLKETGAGAVLLTTEMAQDCSVPSIIVPDPYRAYALVSQWYETALEPVGSSSQLIHPTAIIDASAQIAEGVQIGPYSVIGAHTRLEKNVTVGSHVSIADHCVLAEETRLFDHVTCYSAVRIGKRGRIHSGAVLGADGFGYAPSPEGWVRIAQIGGVVLQDDVHVGAATTIDRGALSDTVIEQGVIIDNQVQIAHNCVIGAYSAIAGCVGIAGSTKIGRWCTLAGACGIAGHVELVDHVHIGMQAQVTKSILQPGYYASGTGLWSVKHWRRMVARLRRSAGASRC